MGKVGTRKRLSAREKHQVTVSSPRKLRKANLREAAMVTSPSFLLVLLCQSLQMLMTKSKIQSTGKRKNIRKTKIGKRTGRGKSLRRKTKIEIGKEKKRRRATETSTRSRRRRSTTSTTRTGRSQKQRRLAAR